MSVTHCILKTIMLRKGIFIGLLFLLGLTTAKGQGSGMALDFDGVNDYVNVGNLPLGTGDFSVEMWVKVDQITAAGGWSDPAFFANKNWNSGANTGICVHLQSGGNYRVNFKGATGSRVDLACPGSLIGSWHHIAITCDRSGQMHLYRDGFLRASASIAGSGGTIEGALGFSLGQDGTGNYQVKFDGKLDEVRVWSDVRTETEIRTYLTRRLQGNEPGLLSYWTLDDGTGNTALDRSSGSRHGSLVGMNNSAWVISEASLGDTSVFLYPSGANWTGLSLAVAAAGQGAFLLDSVSGSPEAIHLYRVSGVPNITTGIKALGNHQTYFGAYVVGGSSPGFDLEYGYNGYSAAVTDEDSLLLFFRNHNAVTSWSQLVSVRDKANDRLAIQSFAGGGEWIPANFVSAVCNAPTLPGAGNIGSVSAALSWTSGGAGAWNIEYGPQGFTQGNGTLISNISSNPYTLSGLNAATSYDFYVQDTCAGIGTSTWTGPFTFTTLTNLATIGSGSCLDFDGVDDYVSCGNSTTLRPDSFITVEAWIYPESNPGTWDAFMSYTQDNGSSESGYNFTWYSGEWRFFMRTSSMGANAWNNNPGSGNVPLNTWTHLAGTYDGAFIRMYVNGVLEDSLAVTGLIDWNPAPNDFRIGVYHDDNEDWYYDGKVDELRVWKTARTQQEIRDKMCSKLSGNEPGLLGYWRLDDGSGVTAGDDGPNGFNGTLTSMNPGTDWEISAAPIGDESVQDYRSNWSGQSLGLTSGSNGNVSLDQITGNAPGLHVYRVDQAPNFTNGIQNLGGNTVYYGTYLVPATQTVRYRLVYDYANYPNAVTNKANLNLYNRNNNAVTFWTGSGATNVQAANQMVLDSLVTRREFVLADFTASPCPGPSGLGASNVTFTSADLGWTAGSGQSSSNLEWGLQGFIPGNGNRVSGLAGSPFAVNGLTASTSYDFYVQDSCGASGSLSSWVGPFTFTTPDRCPPPSNASVTAVTASTATLQWTSGGSAAWNLEWGLAGFQQGTGIVTQVTTNPYTFPSLFSGTTYDVYLQDDCDSLTSTWIGPLTFTTDSMPNGVVTASGMEELRVSPNPAAGEFSVWGVGEGAVEISLLDPLGRKVMHRDLVGRAGEPVFMRPEVPAGMYWVQVKSRDGIQVGQVVLK